MKDENGIEVYRLEKISDRDGPGSLITKKKIK